MTAVRRLLALPLWSAVLCTVAAPAWGQSSRLFDASEVLELRIATDLKGLMMERDSLELRAFPGQLSYLDPGGERVSAEVQVKLRGHWRRQRNNCDFAPLKLDFTDEGRAGTIFEGQGDLKLVVHCRKGRQFEQYVLREYMAYRLYNVLTPLSLRARLARTWYVDTTGRSDSLLAYAFLLENARKAAERNGARVLDAKGVRWEDVDPDQAALVSAFLFLIGGTDWSLPMLHNILLFRDSATQTIRPVAHDFDWTGLVSASYARPDARLPIRTVRQRLYRGICRTPEEWAPVLGRFHAGRPALYALYDSLPHLDPKYVRQTREYLDEFFEVIGRADRLERELIAPCRSR